MKTYLFLILFCPSLVAMDFYQQKEELENAKVMGQHKSGSGEVQPALLFLNFVQKCEQDGLSIDEVIQMIEKNKEEMPALYNYAHENKNCVELVHKMYVLTHMSKHV